MADADELVVTIEEEKPQPETVPVKVEEKPAAVAKPAPEVPAEPAADLKDQFDALKKRNETAERDRITAQREAQTARAEAQAARSEASETRVETTAAGIEAGKAQLEALRREQKAAFDAADFDKASELNLKMAETAADVKMLERQKRELEAEPAPQQQPADPVEAFARGRSPATAAWIRSHPDLILTGKQNRMTAAHYDALDKGRSPDTPEYFEHVENYLGLKENTAEPKPEPKPAPRRASAPPPAPVSQSPGGNGVSGGNEVRLTRGEAAAATDGITHVWNYDDPSPQKKFKKGDPIGIQEFARRKRALLAQGRYDRTYTEDQ